MRFVAVRFVAMRSMVVWPMVMAAWFPRFAVGQHPRVVVVRSQMAPKVCLPLLPCVQDECPEARFRIVGGVLHSISIVKAILRDDLIVRGAACLDERERHRR